MKSARNKHKPFMIKED
jgi:hypothetical protein